jgi:hypothetical protein
MIKIGVLNYSKINSWCLEVLFKDAFSIRSGFYIMHELRGRMLVHVILYLLFLKFVTMIKSYKIYAMTQTDVKNLWF